MIKLEKSKALGRKIRQDDPGELVIPTWTLVRDSIRAGKVDEALDFLDYGCRETKTMHDSLVSFVDDLLTYLGNINEEEIPKVIRKRYEPVVRRWLSDTPGVKESLERCTEFQRSHGGNAAIAEEADRYVLTCDPCGSGGQLRRAKDAGKVKKAGHWTWGKSGVPYYCAHCCLMWEILPTEIRGYPIRINLMGERPEDPCVHLFYKKPELIPEEYFTRIGQSSKFKHIKG